MARLEKNRSRKAMIEPQRASGARGTNSLRRAFFTAAIRDERGQAIIWVALSLVLFLAASAFAVDLGHAMLVRKQLQASSDAAALAAAWHISDGTYAAVADTYSSTGTLNNYGGYTVDTPKVTVKCSSTVKLFGPSCDSSATPPTYNMVIVQETAHVQTFFAGVIGYPTITVTTTSAASKGARPTPFNVAIVLDTTASMSYTDNNCKISGVAQTQLKCAEHAIETIIEALDPSQDKVSIFTFPAMKVGSTAKETTCSGSSATYEPYTFPSTSGSTVATPTLSTGVSTTYEILGFDSGYLNSYGGSLTSSDPLVTAIGHGSCTGIVADAGTHFTYFAASIYQAQEALLAEQAAELTSGLKTSNAMIILSDGNASAIDTTSPDFQDMTCTSAGLSGVDCPSATVTNGVRNNSDGIYPDLVGQCGQAVDAAQSFNNFVVNPDGTSTGTLVFSVAYGASTGPDKARSGLSEGICDSDRAGYTPNDKSAHAGITPCQTMADMASPPWNGESNFFSDYNATGGDAGCVSPNSAVDAAGLDAIAAAIVSRLSESRLVPPDAP